MFTSQEPYDPTEGMNLPQGFIDARQTPSTQQVSYPPRPPVTNDSLGQMRQQGQLPPQPPPQQSAQWQSDEVVRIMEAVKQRGWPPEVALRILERKGYTPQRIQQDLAFRTLLDRRQNYERDRRLSDLESAGGVARKTAESFEDPGPLWQQTGLPGTPYSPTRGRVSKENQPQWEKVPDEEGNLWYVDKTQRAPPRPVMLPTGEGGRPQQARQQSNLNSSELESLRDNTNQLMSAVRASGLLRGETVEGQKGDPEATGWKGFLWDPLLQRMDPEGVATRSALGNIASLKIKQRSGGAVPAAEMERLKPFIPRETDDPPTARVKMSQFLREYITMLEEDMKAFEGAGRRIPVALKNRVAQLTGLARQVQSNLLPADRALDQSWRGDGRSAAGGQGNRPSPQELFRLWQEQQGKR